jgi:hypothetical protein
MALAQVELAVTLTQINCGDCGGTYAINERYRQQKAEKSGFWNCPYCKCSWGYGKGENAELRDQVAATQQRLNAALSRENEERAAKEKVERKLKRVKRGVCPECNRTFQNLALHMTCKHGAEAPR